LQKRLAKASRLRAHGRVLISGLAVTQRLHRLIELPQQSMLPVQVLLHPHGLPPIKPKPD